MHCPLATKNCGNELLPGSTFLACKLDLNGMNAHVHQPDLGNVLSETCQDFWNRVLCIEKNANCLVPEEQDIWTSWIPAIACNICKFSNSTRSILIRRIGSSFLYLTGNWLWLAIKSRMVTRISLVWPRLRDRSTKATLMVTGQEVREGNNTKPDFNLTHWP